MTDLAPILDACGILVGTGADGQFSHLGTAWALGDGDWVAAWSAEEPPVDARLLRTCDGAVCEVTAWECEDGVAGFTSAPGPSALALATGRSLHKRDPLRALGYPSMIDHPAFRLHHGSLDPQRYVPYVCPWVLEGHLALFSSQDGWLVGRFYAGMAGGPVIDQAGDVVGVLIDGSDSDHHPPLARFRRLV
ncbi:MAG: hypothetical protein H0V44_08845 [Planctomycetes bacterium]|nr:hypothetical protein [Planctomycetota bacterium]